MRHNNNNNTARIDRRRFLKGGASATLATLAAAAAASTVTGPGGILISSAQGADALTADPDGLTTYQLGPQIWIRYDNQPLTCYRAHPTQKYPYLYPLSGPVSGLSLTSETALPYPHHRSLFFGCDQVNGGNYWQEGFEQGQVISSGPTVGGSTTPHTAEIKDACSWHKPSAQPVMSDTRTILVSVPSPRLRFIDFDITWTAVEDIAIKKTNHSLFSLRAAVDIVPKSGGTLINALGDRDEKGTYGKKAAWCAFYGKRAGAGMSVSEQPVEGIAILDHPKNPWSPCAWFTRDYGFMSPTPFQFIEEPWKLKSGDSVRLRYRVVLFAGDTREANLDGIYKDWAV